MIFSAIKQSDHRRPWRYHVERRSPEGMSVQSFYRTGGMSVGSTRVTLFNRTKDFKPGRFSVNPFDARSCSGRDSGGATYLHYKYAGKVYVSTILTGEVMASIAAPSWDTVSPAEIDVASRDATHVRAFGKMNAPGLDLGPVFGELGETLNSLRNPLKNIRNLFTRMAKRPSQNIGRNSTFNRLSDAWLEYRYDVMPNVLTAQDIIARFKKQRGFAGHLESKTSMDGVTRSRIETENTSSIEGYSLHWKRIKVTAASTATKVYYVRKDLHLADYGLSIVDVPRVAWELIPYSFVVDWFLGVGDWLDAHRSMTDKTVLGVTHSTKITTTDTYQPLGFWSIVSPNNYEPSKPGPYVHTTEKFIRVIGDASLPALPLVKQHWATIHRIADAVALSREYLPKILTQRR